MSKQWTPAHCLLARRRRAPLDQARAPDPRRAILTRGGASRRPLLKRPKPGSFRPQAWLALGLTDGAQERRLLQFDRGASSFQVLLELRGVFLRSGFLHDATGLGEVLGFLQAQAGDRADGLDHVDLLVAGALQDHVELGLLFGGRGGGTTGGGHGDRGSGGNAKLLFDGLHQLHHFHQRLGGDGFNDLFVAQGHFDLPLEMDSLRIRRRDQAAAGASAASPPPCLSATALTARANIAAGSASTRASMASASSRVGSEASTSTCAAGSSLPSTETTRAFSLSLLLANSLIRRPAAPGSSVENAYSSGPVRASLTTSNSVPATARDASVFLTTFRNTPVSRAFLRIAVICSTVVPAYSAATRE